MSDQRNAFGTSKGLCRIDAKRDSEGWEDKIQEKELIWLRKGKKKFYRLNDKF